MSDNNEKTTTTTTTTTTTPSEGNTTVQKKKSYSRQRHRKSVTNLEEKAKISKSTKSLNSNASDKSSSKKGSSQLSESKSVGDLKKKQVNQENNSNNNKPEDKKVNEKKDNDKKKKNRYNKKKSVNDLKKEEQKAEKAVEKPEKEVKKSASKLYLNQKKQRKSKLNLKSEKTKPEIEDSDKSENDDIKLIGSFLTTLSLKRDEMEKENNNETSYPPNNKYTKKPNYNYTNKATKPKKELPEYDEKEILKVLDCYDFPTSFKTHNLIEIFKEFEGHFRINWINDSRALFIFNTVENANAAYLSRIYETKFKVKPYENPQKPANYVKNEEKPIRKPRPLTSDVVARRLISGALGIRPKEKTEEEKELDKIKFEQARAKKLEEKLERLKRKEENNKIFDE